MAQRWCRSSNEVFAGELGCFYREYEEPGPEHYSPQQSGGERAAGRVLDRLYIVPGGRALRAGGSNSSKSGAAGGQTRQVAGWWPDEFRQSHLRPDVPRSGTAAGRRALRGIYHLVNEGWASRYEWAAELLRLSGRGHIPLTPSPPANGLDKRAPGPRVLVKPGRRRPGHSPAPWQEALAEYVKNEAPKA